MNKRQKETQQVFLDHEKAVLKRLEEVYQDALDEINSKIESLLARQDADMAHVIYQVEYQRALKDQVSAILEQLHNNEFETLSEYLAQSYEDGFIGTMYDLQGQGIPLVIPIDQEQIVAAIQHETKLSESLYTALGKDTKDLSKKIAGEISRGISSGMLYVEIARNIAAWGKIPKNNAMRIARTESHRIQCKAAMDAQWKAKNKGADVVKQWDATLDARTRDSHARVDGEIRELDEEFSNGLLYPGDPSGRAEEVINCRCALLQRARWALDAETTQYLGNVSEMPEKRQEVIAKKLNIPVWELEKYSGQIVPIKAKNYEDFKEQYNRIWRYEGSDLQKEAEARIAGYKKPEQKTSDKDVILEQTVKISRKAHDSDYGAVNRNFVNSKRFHDKYEGLTKHKAVNEVLYQESMKILEHRDGTPFEDMVIVDARTGNVILRITDSNIVGKLKITKEDYQKIAEYEDGIILLHNHPNSSRPSHTDIFKLREKNTVGVVAVGHDGSVYMVSELNTEINIENLWKDAYNKFKEIGKDDILARHYATDVLYGLDVFQLESR